MKYIAAFSALPLSLTLSIGVQAATVTFDDNALSPNSFFNPETNTTFNSGGVTFTHSWIDAFDCCWGNFTYSNRSDTTTAGFTNDRSAITGSGANGSENYGVSNGDNAFIDFGQSVSISSADFTNTTYAYLSMLNGDNFAKQFEAGDFFRLTITGKDENNADTGSVVFSLAEGTNIVDQWETVSLSSLGTINSLVFSYDSSDVGGFGINTPAYFAIDNIEYQAVPVPAAAWLFLSGLAGLRIIKRKK